MAPEKPFVVALGPALIVAAASILLYFRTTGSRYRRIIRVTDPSK
jgi:hypothetical protein